MPIILIVVCMVAAAFAVVAALFASIVLILLAKYGSQQQPSSSHSVMLGVLLGALIGALHPFVIVWLIVAGLGTDGAFALGGLRLAAVVMISGAVAGASWCVAMVQIFLTPSNTGQLGNLACLAGLGLRQLH